MAINRDKVHAAAAKLLQQGKFDKAIAELVKLVEDDSTDVRTWLKLGETYPKIGRKKEALDAFEKAANIYAEQGFFLKAVAVLKQLLRVDPNVPPMHLKLAELYQQLGLTPDALQHYQNVAVFYEQQGRARETLDILKRMVDLDPDNLPSRIKLGELFAQQGLQQEAAQELRSALGFLKAQQRFDDFARVAEKLIAYDVGALDVARELAQIYLNQKQPSLALSKLQIAFKYDSRNVTTLQLMAQAFLDMQQVPKTVLVYKELARIHTTDGNAALAQRQWQQVLELEPADVEAATALGRVPAGDGPEAAPTILPQPAPGAARPAPAPARTSADAQAETLTRLMTETDVYVKYGLKEKALEHLKKIYAIRADFIPALEKERQLLQPHGGRELKDALRRLVAAADDQGHQRLAEWKAELSQTDNKPGGARPATVVGMVPAAILPGADSRSLEEIVIDSQDGASEELLDEPILEDPSGAIRLDPSQADEPFLPEEVSSLPDLPPDESGEDLFGDEPDAFATAPTSAREVPRSHGVVIPAAAPAPLVLAEQEFDASEEILSGEGLVEADDLVRQALADISQEDLSAAADDILGELGRDDLFGGGDAAQANEPVIPARGARPAVSPLESALVEAGSQEGQPLVDGARAGFGKPDVASTALMGLSSAELDEIREFEGDTAAPDPRAGAERKAHAARAVDEERAALEMRAGLEDFGFDEPTMALPPEASSNSPTAERRRGRAELTEPLPPGERSASHSAGFGEPSGEFDPSKFDLPDDVKAMLGAGGTSASAGAAVPAPVPVPAPPFLLAPADAAPPSSVELAPLAGGTGKLGLASKGQGFEDDPANQFFPDELEEAEFFIQQDLLDEAREILTNILDDVPDSARVQWMIARIAAKEAGEPEPSAPWERRILEEVQAQLDGLDLPLPSEDAPGNRQVSVEEVLSQFKRGIAETVPEDDAATHYDLGCAYRDMGLLDEAVSEFRIAARATTRAVDARYLIGVTLADQGRNVEAVAALDEALGIPSATRDQKAACLYQRGACFEADMALADALLSFKQAKAFGHAAADIDRRIAALVAKVGDLDATASPAATAAPSKAKNIDYL